MVILRETASPANREKNAVENGVLLENKEKQHNNNNNNNEPIMKHKKELKRISGMFRLVEDESSI